MDRSKSPVPPAIGARPFVLAEIRFTGEAAVSLTWCWLDLVGDVCTRPRGIVTGARLQAPPARGERCGDFRGDVLACGPDAL